MFETVMERCVRNPRGTASGYLVYVSGPISGDVAGNLPPFFDAEKRILAAGHSTFNPARVDGGETAAQCLRLAQGQEGHKTWHDYMRQSLAGLIRCNAIATLPGWWLSSGANIELRLANDLGYGRVDHEDGTLIRAPRLVNGAMPEFWATV